MDQFLLQFLWCHMGQSDWLQIQKRTAVVVCFTLIFCELLHFIITLYLYVHKNDKTLCIIFKYLHMPYKGKK